MTTYLQHQLGLTGEAIEKIQMDFFLMYADTVATDTVEYQLMLINKPLQNWFERQFRQGEQRYFAFMARATKPMKQKRAQELYLHFVSGFIDKFSKKIIYDIRKEAKAIRAYRKRINGSVTDSGIHFN